MSLRSKFVVHLLVLLFAYVCSETYPTCGECWCIPALNGSAPCPKFWQPKTEFSNSSIETYKKQLPTNIYALNCNPYADSSCTTTPPQQLLDNESAVCAFLYPTNSDNTQSCSAYSTVTYGSRENARAAGAVLTHEGSCGLCSTTQDLAIYLTQDFTDAGKKCATKGLFNEEAGLDCYMSLGLTKECAKIWNYDGIYDGQTCTTTCLGEITAPNNGPAPACTINDCLQCDEDKAGPIFSAYAGRTRRRSGLLSEIVRPCSSIARINVYDACTNPACNC